MAVGGLSGGGIITATIGATSPTGPHFLQGPFFWPFIGWEHLGSPYLLVNKLMILALCEKAYASNAEY